MNLWWDRRRGSRRPADSSSGANLGIEGIEDPVEIGRGGFGIVYSARQPALNRTVAVKVLAAQELSAEETARFTREVRAMGAVSGHPGIVTIFHGGVTMAGRPYILMEYMSGGSLADRLDRDGSLPWRVVLGLGDDLAEALGAAHESGILHRDIKPGNILVSAYGQTKLGDFGIARLQGSDHTRSSVLNLSVAHAPPELLQGSTPTPASDVYSLASTLVTLARGVPPFVGDTGEPVATTLTRILTAPPPDLAAWGWPEPVANILLAALARDPADRPSDGAALAVALREATMAAGISPSDSRNEANALLRQRHGPQAPSRPSSGLPVSSHTVSGDSTALVTGPLQQRTARQTEGSELDAVSQKTPPETVATPVRTNTSPESAAEDATQLVSKRAPRALRAPTSLLIGASVSLCAGLVLLLGAAALAAIAAAGDADWGRLYTDTSTSLAARWHSIVWAAQGATRVGRGVSQTPYGPQGTYVVVDQTIRSPLSGPMLIVGLGIVALAGKAARRAPSTRLREAAWRGLGGALCWILVMAIVDLCTRDGRVVHANGLASRLDEALQWQSFVVEAPLAVGLLVALGTVLGQSGGSTVRRLQVSRGAAAVRTIGVAGTSTALAVLMMTLAAGAWMVLHPGATASFVHDMGAGGAVLPPRSVPGIASYSLWAELGLPTAGMWLLAYGCVVPAIFVHGAEHGLITGSHAASAWVAMALPTVLGLLTGMRAVRRSASRSTGEACAAAVITALASSAMIIGLLALVSVSISVSPDTGSYQVGPQLGRATLGVLAVWLPATLLGGLTTAAFARRRPRPPRPSAAGVLLRVRPRRLTIALAVALSLPVVAVTAILPLTRAHTADYVALSGDRNFPFLASLAGEPDGSTWVVTGRAALSRVDARLRSSQVELPSLPSDRAVMTVVSDQTGGCWALASRPGGEGGVIVPIAADGTVGALVNVPGGFLLPWQGAAVVEDDALWLLAPPSPSLTTFPFAASLLRLARGAQDMTQVGLDDVEASSPLAADPTRHALWYASSAARSVIRVSTDSSTPRLELPLSLGAGHISGLAVSRGNVVWAAIDLVVDAVPTGKLVGLSFDPARGLTSVDAPGFISDVTRGPDGAVWFAGGSAFGETAIGEVYDDGTVTMHLVDFGVRGRGLALAGDAVWFGDFAVGGVGRLKA